MSYPVVRRIIAGLDRGLVALAHGGAQEYRDDFELVLRRKSVHPNDIWQADHTELDLMVLDETGRPARAVVDGDLGRPIPDFTSDHIAQVCADVKVQLVHSTPG